MTPKDARNMPLFSSVGFIRPADYFTRLLMGMNDEGEIFYHILS